MSTNKLEMRYWRFAFGALLGLVASCVDPEPQPGQSSLDQELRPGHALRLQEGDRLVVLGITEDDHALFWDAGSVYAAALYPGAPRRLVAAAAEPPMTMVVGRVALVWTAQPFFVPAQVSPLVVWTAAAGARPLTSASWAPLTGSLFSSNAVSPDGREVVFTANVSADGATGDIVRVSTDLSQVMTLVAAASVSPFSACPPQVGFDRTGPASGGPGRHARISSDGEAEPSLGSSRRRAAAIVSSCAAADPSVATLARWEGSRRVELSAGVVPGRFWSTDDRGRVFTQLADQSSAVFSPDGTVTVVEPRRSLGWITREGTVITRVRTSPTSVVLQRTTLDPALSTETITELGGATGFMFANHLAQGIPHYDVTPIPTSQDGQIYGGFNQVNPATGQTDAFLVDLSQAGRAPTQVRAEQDVFPSFEIATRDSSHLLYYTVDFAAGTNAMFAASRDGASRQLSEGNTTFAHFGLRGSTLVFSDNAVGNPVDLLSTNDIKIADVAAPERAPRVLARQAYEVFFPTPERRFVIYTSDAGPEHGLFAVRAR